MSYLYFGIPIVFLLFITILVIVFHCRKKYAIRKVCSMCPEEKKELPAKLKTAADAVKAFCLSGAAFAMNHYNK